MRPCQHCGTPLELHIKACEQCGTKQVETVGLAAKDPIPREPAESDAAENLFNDSRVILVPLFVSWCVVGIAAWYVSGSVAIGIGALVATFAVCCLFLDVSLFIS